jgi:hypothetical protein
VLVIDQVVDFIDEGDVVEDGEVRPQDFDLARMRRRSDS